MTENKKIVTTCSTTADFVSVTFTLDSGERQNRTFLREQNPRLYTRALTAVRKEDYECLAGLSLNLLDDLNAIDERFEVRNGKDVFFEGRQLHNFVTGRIADLYRAGQPITNWVNFLKNTMANSHAITVEDIYRFLDNHEGCPITEDGAILAYKKVDENYMSFFRSNITGKSENWAPGETVELPREHCDPDRTVTCSAGLHFCSRSYLPCFYGSCGKVVMVKIFPQDIVAIPVEYDFAKGRCCRAFVLKDIPDLNTFAFGSFYTAQGDANESVNEVVASGLDSDTIEHISGILSAYAYGYTKHGRKVRATISELTERLTKYAESIGDEDFIYDEEDILFVIGHTDDEDVIESYDVELVTDVFINIS